MFEPSLKSMVVGRWIVAVLVLSAVGVVISISAGSRSNSFLTTAGLNSAPPFATPVTPQIRDHIRAEYAALPLAFEANQGQVDPQVKYTARGSGYTLSLTSADAVFDLSSQAPSSRVMSSGRNALLGAHLHAARGEVKSATIHMHLVGGNSRARVDAGRELPGKVNYYLGSDSRKWQQGVRRYESVAYRDVYPGVDMVFHGQQRQVEFDFVVSPAASSSSIQLGFAGARRIATNTKGDLVLSSSAGEVVLRKPLAYQEKDGQRQLVEVAFDATGKTVAFALGPYDHTRQLVIDPSLSYATYLGGSSEDEAFAIAVDSGGNMYVTGQTNSPTFGGLPAGPNFDVFITEINASGTALVYTSILSGTGACSGDAIAVDGAGAAYVAGGATSGFPILGGVQTTYGGGLSDAFVLKLAPTTGALSFSTYLGGSQEDTAYGIAVDTSSPPNVYVAGGTSSTNFPGTSTSTIQSSLTGNEDAFITKINGSGSTIVYSTYLGGSVDSQASGIALDTSTNVYVAGFTGPGFPTTAGVVQTSIGGGENSFVSEVNAAGSALTYSTYLGGSGTDDAFGIAVDSAGEAYITGSTTSPNFPTVNPAQSALGGSSATNVFVSKLNAGATALVFSTYYGGTQDDVGTAIALDSFGDAYVTGRTTSSNYPVSSAFQGSLNGTSDAFVTEFNNTGFVEYSSFLGGPGTENGLGGSDGNAAIGGITVDSASNSYLAGATASTTGFPLQSALQSNYGGGLTDAFVAKVGAAPADFSIAVSPASVSVTSGQTTSAITVTVSSVNASFGQSVSLSCGNVPSQATCNFTPSSVTPGSSPVTSNLTISTGSSSSAALLTPTSNRPAQVLAATYLPILGIAALGAGMTRRKKATSRLMFLGLILTGLMLLPACGGSSGKGGGGGGGGSGTTPGTYAITVSGAAGSTTHSAPLSLTVN